MRHKFLVDARVIPGRSGVAVRPGIGPIGPLCREEPSMTEIPREVAYLVSFILIEAAVIDGRSLRVPNWLTLHFAVGGWVYALWSGGGPSLGWSLAGSAVGLACLMPLYAIGGMGAGDVKLMAGVGAWIGPACTFWAFLATALVGGLMGLAMMAASGELARHIALTRAIGREVLTVRDPAALSELAARRKPSMMLLPYGIPIAVGTISYLGWAGFLA
jgi:prepilin peptidase CpaA